MNKLKRSVGAVLLAAALVAPVAPGTAHETGAHGAGVVVKSISGAASWYGPKFHGRLTASGEPFDMHQLTAAHRTLPFGTRVRVTHVANDRSVVVRINDRGPFHGKRVIDLSRKAAEVIGLVQRGVGKVKVEVLART